MTTSSESKVIWLVERDGRQYFFNDSLPDWVVGDDNYQVSQLVRMHVLGDNPISQAVSETFPEEFQAFKDMANDLFDLQGKQIDRLTAQLEEFIETIEAVVEIAIPTDHLIECKAKLLLINEQCKKLLAAKHEEIE